MKSPLPLPVLNLPGATGYDSAVVPKIGAALAAQAAGNAGIGAIVNPAGSGDDRTLQFQRITIPAGGKFPVLTTGDFVYIEGVVALTAASGPPSFYNSPSVPILTIKSDVGNVVFPLNVFRREIRFPRAFTFLEFSASIISDISVTVWIGFGGMRLDATREFGTTSGQFMSTAGGVHAIGNCFGPTNVQFSQPVNGYHQRARIAKAIAFKNSTILTDADFTLWLFASPITVTADNTAFVFFPANGIGVDDYIGKLRFPKFETGGAGSNSSTCELTNVGLDIFAYPEAATGILKMRGALTANAAYDAAAVDLIVIYLTLEFF